MKPKHSHFKSLLTTLVVYCCALFLSLYIILNVSTGWGAFLFLVLAVFIGIPMTGSTQSRWLRMGIFVVAMVFFMIYASALRYDPFTSAVPFSGTHVPTKDCSVTLSPFSTKILAIFYGHKPTQLYTCYTSNDEYYWMQQGSEYPGTQEVQGYFVASPDTEVDFLVMNGSHHIEPEKYRVHVGYFLSKDEAENAVGNQNKLLLLFVALFALGFVFEEFFFSGDKEETPKSPTTNTRRIKNTAPQKTKRSLKAKKRK